MYNRKLNLKNVKLQSSLYSYRCNIFNFREKNRQKSRQYLVG
jgi:hypothetical protein